MKELYTIREYEFNGIKVLVALNRLDKTASLVEWDKSSHKYMPKRWLFEQRQVGYVRSWAKILNAMSQATEHAIEELEAWDDEDDENALKLIMALDESNHAK